MADYQIIIKERGPKSSPTHSMGAPHRFQYYVPGTKIQWGQFNSIWLDLSNSVSQQCPFQYSAIVKVTVQYLIDWPWSYMGNPWCELFLGWTTTHQGAVPAIEGGITIGLFAWFRSVAVKSFRPQSHGCCQKRKVLSHWSCSLSS